MENSTASSHLKIWLLRLVKLGLFALILTAFYAIYLDAWVKERMAGNKWETPVKVYARPLNLYQGLFLSQRDLIAELKLLNYTKVEHLHEPGQFSVSENAVEVYRRGFMSPTGSVSPKRLAINFSGQFVVGVKHIEEDEWQATSMVGIEPLLISRQSSSDNEVRDIINLASVPEWMVDTLLTVEDKNFYHHHGVSVFAIARAMWANLLAGRKVQGGSTLTQQLAKNLLLNDSRKTYLRKFKEAIVALILDYRYSKDDILEAYFNEIYMGQNGKNGVHGFALGSKFYFNKPLAELQYHEFALLVALVKGPSYYDPRRFPERAKERRDLVLQLMVSDRILERQEYALHVDQPMVIRKDKPRSGAMFPAYSQQVQRELERLDIDAQSESGVMVFTGLDPILQQRQQALFEKSLQRIEKGYKLENSINGAVVSVALDNGQILSIVGDRNAHAYGFNRALDAKRNIGSLVKPAVYLTALKGEYHLGSLLSNKAVKMKNQKGQLWQPQNYDKSTSESVLLKDGLVNSLNLPTIHLGMELGLRKVGETIESLGYPERVPSYPSILLGAIAMTPLDVAAWYQGIASFGQQYEVMATQSVITTDGIVLWEHDKEPKQVMDYETAYVLNHALHMVTQEGTSKRLGMYYPKVNYAGKTGTTDDLRDSWFTGFDQNKLTTVWIGMDDNSPVNLTGSQGALTAFIDLQAAKPSQSIVVPKPNSVEMRAFDIQTGEIFVKECGEHVLMPILQSKITQQKSCPSIFDIFK